MISAETKNGGDLFKFASVADLMEWSDPDKFEVGRLSFVGEELESWEAVSKRSKRDWAEGLYILNEYVEELSKVEIPNLKSYKRQTEFNEYEGDEVDYDKLFAGQPFWRTTKREASTGPNEVTICIDTTTPADEKSENILWRGAAGIALAIILEEKGYKVELWVVNGSRLYSGKDTPVMTACCLKKPSDPLDKTTLVNTVAGWFYRTALFTVLKTICAFKNETPEYGLGTWYTPSASDLKVVTPDELVIYSAGVFSKSGAANTIRIELEKLNNRD